jgi:asparagine synthase (glutamine-hydrolysing)
LLHPDLRRELADYHPIELFRPWYDRAPAHDPLSRVQYLDFHTWLPEYILTKTDRATMMHSLEAREPLLDYRIVELAASLRPDLKLRGGVAKWLLKRAFEAHLPPQTIERPKQGFSPPLARWIDHDLRGRVEQLVAPRWLDPQVVQQRAQAQLRGARDHSELLYQVLVLSSFERHWSRRFAREPASVGS